jgi:hypothetical protein
METILTELAKPAFWAFSVVLAIVINLASAYLKNPLDSTLSSISSRWRTRTAARRRRWSDRIDRLAASEAERHEERMQEIRERFHAVALTLLAIATLIAWQIREENQGNLFSPLVSRTALNAWVTYLFIHAGVCWFSAIDCAAALQAAARLRRRIDLDRAAR